MILNNNCTSLVDVCSLPNTIDMDFNSDSSKFLIYTSIFLSNLTVNSINPPCIVYLKNDFHPCLHGYFSYNAIRSKLKLS